MADKAAPIAHPDSRPAGFGRGIPTQPRRSGQRDLRRVTITPAFAPEPPSPQGSETQRPTVQVELPASGPDRAERSENWLREKHSLIVGADSMVIIAAVLFVSFSTIDAGFLFRLSWETVSSAWVFGVIVMVSWLALLAMEGVWDTASLTNSARDIRRTLMSSLLVFAGVGMFGYLAESDLARPYLLLAAPIGTAGLLVNHLLWRRRVESLLRSGQENISTEPRDSIGFPAMPCSGAAAGDPRVLAGGAPSPVRPSRRRRAVRSALDVILAALGIVLLSPLLLLAAIAIPLVDGGPVFHQQEYVGRAGRVFTGWTFRCTPYGPMARPAAVGVSYGSARRIEYGLATTSIGRLLRRTGLVSSPLLFTVLARQMAIVGPKPSSPWNSTPHPDAIRPGITGRWRVGVPRHEPIDGGIDSAATSSIAGDIAIIFRTLRLGVTGRLSG